MRISTTPVIIMTGYPATGKTTLANILAQELALPLIWKDSFKETLAESLGWSNDEWSRKLGIASWALLYQQVETLASAGVPFIVEGNFAFAHASLAANGTLCIAMSYRKTPYKHSSVEDLSAGLKLKVNACRLKLRR